MPLQGRVKGGILGLHDATKKTAQELADEAKAARLESIKLLKPKKPILELTAKEKQDALDAMLEEWLLLK